MAETSDQLTGSVREFLHRAFPSKRRQVILEAAGRDDRLWEQAAELGWFSLLAPEGEHGLGLHPVQLVPVFRLFGDRLVGGQLLEQMLLPGLLGTWVTTGSKDLAMRLHACVSGTARIAVVDGGATHDWGQMNGAVGHDSGRLSGSVELVRCGAAADELLVVANATHVPVVALVPVGRPGVGITKRSSHDPVGRFARATFEGVALEGGDVLARGDQAAPLAELLRAWQRILIAAELAGIAHHVLRLSVDYIQEREQFGRPVAAFQAVRHIAASVAQRVIMLENFCDAVVTDAPAMSLDELSLTAMALKAQAAETARSACEDGLQMHGGIGFTYEHELHWYYKRALALRTWLGDERELAVEIGRRRLSV